MPTATKELIQIKRRLMRNLLAAAKRWEDRTYMAFVSADRRRVRSLALRLKAKLLAQEISQLIQKRRIRHDPTEE
jgi:hypothetical protein